MKNPEIEGQIIASEKKEEKNQEWMRGPDGEFYCPDCWLEVLACRSQEDAEDGTNFLDYFLKDSKPVLNSDYYPGMKNEACEKCQTFVPKELIERVKKVSKKRRQKQQRLENREEVVE